MNRIAPPGSLSELLDAQAIQLRPHLGSIDGGQVHADLSAEDLTFMHPMGPRWLQRRRLLEDQ